MGGFAQGSARCLGDFLHLLGFFDEAAPQAVFQIAAFADGSKNQRVFLLASLPFASLLVVGEHLWSIQRGQKGVLVR